MKEPWIRVVKKAELGKRETLILRLEAIILALVAGGLFILLIGQNPFVIYQTILTGDGDSGNRENYDSASDCVVGCDAGI